MELMEAEISQIIKNRQSAGSQPTGGAPPMQGGNMSGVLGNASAAVSLCAGQFSESVHIKKLFDRTAPPLERVMSGGFLAFKLAVVAVISFAIYQEWQQHIISQTEIAAAQAQKLRAEADVAKPFNNAQVRKLEPEAAVSKEVNEAHPPSSPQPTPSSMVSNAPQLAKVTPRRRLNRRLRPQLPRRSKSNFRLHPRRHRRSPRRRRQHRSERRQGSIASTVSIWGRTT